MNLSIPLKDVRVHLTDGEYFTFKQCFLEDSGKEVLSELLKLDVLYFKCGITKNETIIKQEFITSIQIGEFE